MFFVWSQGALASPVEWTGMVRAELFVMSTGHVRLGIHASHAIG